jgi:glyoxylase-like metal-dependent hydrolase (beta-lactamase superfamily II)
MNETSKLNDSAYHIYESNGTYCTLVIGSERALLIDTGYGCSDLLGTVSSLTDKPVVVANTHGHFDHSQMNCFFPSAYIHKDDVALLKKNVSVFYKAGLYLLYLSKMPRDARKQFLKTMSLKSPRLSLIKDGDVIDLGGTSIRVIETPGHTKGSVCFLDEKNRFVYCGDSVSNHVWICLTESLRIPVYLESLERLRALIDDSYKIIASHSDVPLNYAVLPKLIDCVRRIDFGKSAKYVNPFCKRSYLYCEGLEYLRERYGVSSFGEMIKKIETIDKDVFRNGEFVSIVYRLDKL